MRECFDAEMLLQYLDQGLSEAEARTVEAHVQACGRCERTLARLADGAGPALAWLVDALEGPGSRSAEAGPQDGDTTDDQAAASSGGSDLPGAGPACWPDPDTARVAALLEEGGRYRVLGEVGRGGMGWVLRGRDLRLGRDLAFKVLRPEYRGSPEVERRFVLEARVCSQLQHPGIVPVYEAGRLSDGQPYFAMKLIDGQTLARLLAARPGPADGLGRWLGVFVQVCQAVARAHSRGVLHRDLKPGNVMIGEFDEVQVMDWGMAKVRDLAAGPMPAEPGTEAAERPAGSDPADVTRTGTRMGTLAYMAPEQARGEVGRLDPRCDVFGLGAILCEILTGRPPYQGKGLVEKACAGDLSDAWARLDGCGADPDLVGLVRRCLAADPAGRPADAGAVAAEVGGYLAGAQERLRQAELARAQAEVRATEERKRRQVQLALVAALVGLLGVGIGGGLYLQRQQELRSLERAQRQLETQTTLEKADELRRLGHWSEARALLEQMNAQLGEEAPENLRARVNQALTDVVLVGELDAIRLNKATLVDYAFDKVGAYRAYAEVFARRGLGSEQDDPVVVAARVRDSAVREQLLAALDDWVFDTIRDQSRSSWLLEVARRADPHPWRNRLRDPAPWADPKKLQALVAGAKSEELSPPLVTALAWRLGTEQALEFLRAVQRRHPDDFWINFTLGTYLQRANPEEAIGYLRVAVALRPTSSGAHNNLGLALNARGQADEAIVCYRKILELEPRNPFAYTNLGNALSHKGRFDEAIACFRKAIELNPRNEFAYNNLGLALASKGQVDEAIACYRKALELHPRYADAHYNLGNAWRTRGPSALDQAIACFLEAIACFREDIELDPRVAKAYNNLGTALRARGKMDEAICCYLKALELDPRFAFAHYNLGNALKATGHLDEAIACYRKTIELQPRLAPAHNNLGDVLSARGQLDEAIACYRKALALDQRNATPHANLGNALRARGPSSVDEAIACFRNALELQLRDADIDRGLGMALLHKGRYGEAGESFARAVRLFPETDPLRATTSWQLQSCERLGRLGDRLPRLLRGEDQPGSATECLDLAEVCRGQQRYAAATRFSAEAFARQPSLADDLPRWHRFNAACCAALAAANQGWDGDTVGPMERRALRRQALTWLRATRRVGRRQLPPVLLEAPARRAHTARSACYPLTWPSVENTEVLQPGSVAVRNEPAKSPPATVWTPLRAALRVSAGDSTTPQSGSGTLNVTVPPELGAKRPWASRVTVVRSRGMSSRPLNGPPEGKKPGESPWTSNAPMSMAAPTMRA